MIVKMNESDTIFTVHLQMLRAKDLPSNLLKHLVSSPLSGNVGIFAPFKHNLLCIRLYPSYNTPKILLVDSHCLCSSHTLNCSRIS